MTLTTNRINISEPLQQICHLLNLRYDQILELTLQPLDATAVICLLNEEGNKYIDPDTDDVAKQTLTFQITT